MRGVDAGGVSGGHDSVEFVNWRVGDFVNFKLTNSLIHQFTKSVLGTRSALHRTAPLETAAKRDARCTRLHMRVSGWTVLDGVRLSVRHTADLPVLRRRDDLD